MSDSELMELRTRLATAEATLATYQDVWREIDAALHKARILNLAPVAELSAAHEALKLAEAALYDCFSAHFRDDHGKTTRVLKDALAAISKVLPEGP